MNIFFKRVFLKFMLKVGLMGCSPQEMITGQEVQFTRLNDHISYQQFIFAANKPFVVKVHNLSQEQVVLKPQYDAVLQYGSHVLLLKPIKLPLDAFTQ